jgi:hypothetical protein
MKGACVARHSRRRLLLVIALVAVQVLVLVVPAVAAGSFGWTCQFVHRCVSRTWETPNRGIHSVTKTTANCPGPGNNMRVRIVHEEFGPDTFYVWKGWDCTDNNQTRRWDSNQTGGFHFDVEKADTNDTTWAWTITGNTQFP